jgi:hypothetical protein
VRVYRWDPVQGILDPQALDRVDYIIHLAGANIGEKRWSEKRRKEIVSSRVDSALLLHRIVSENNILLKAFISASAVGYYGSVTTEKIYTEQDQPANDFLASTCRQWEQAADAFEKSGIRTVKIRTTMVLEKSGIALKTLMMPAKFGFLIRLGSGRQYMPWIHINDLCGIYLKAIEDQNLTGAVNAVSPQHVSHDEFIKALSSEMQKPVFPVNVPSFFLSSVLGEMSNIVLFGSRISSEKIIAAGYLFTFDNLQNALNDIIKQ